MAYRLNKVVNNRGKRTDHNHNSNKMIYIAKSQIKGIEHELQKSMNHYECLKKIGPEL